MARSLDAILKELEPSYAGDRKSIQTQLSAIPASMDAEIAGLDARLGQANDNILAGARRRGMGFSGIPLAEQAQYAATEYAPAVARVQQSGIDRRTSLEGALSGLDRDMRQYAMGLRQQELDRAEQKRQFEAQLRAQREAEARAAARSSAASAAPDLGQYFAAATQASQPMQPTTSEADAAYLGRLRALPKSQQTTIIASLKNGTADAKRRYNLGKQLGYWK